MILAAALWFCTLDKMANSMDRVALAAESIERSAISIKHSTQKIEQIFKKKPMFVAKKRAPPGVVSTAKKAIRSLAQPCTTLTGIDGKYAMKCGFDTPIIVAPSKTGDQRSSIEADDAALVLRATVGKVSLLKEQNAAADVTGDGTVSAYDAAKILDYSVRPEPFPVAQLCGSDWVFFPRSGGDAVWPSVSNGTCNPGKIVVTTRPATAVNFDSLVYGDVDMDWR